jgi:putative peptide zinc metalloprotease protein
MHTTKNPVFELVLEDGVRVPVTGNVTIGRSPESTIQLADPAVSRRHARVSPASGDGDAPLVEDVGSSYGTFVDGRRIEGAEPLRDGARLRLGNHELLVERRRSKQEAGRTIVVPPGASLALPRDGRSEAAAGGLRERPRLRSGYALKRLAATEGPRRWVLKDLVNGNLVRLSDEDAGVIELLDGRRSPAELVGEAERRFGPTGPLRLAQVLADLDRRGLLAGGGPVPAEEPEPSGLTQRLVRPRELVWAGAGEFFERLYRRGGWTLVTKPALAAAAALAAAGMVAFAFLVAARYGTPFVVASKIGLGGLVFVVARFVVAAAHETAHGLAMASFGRRVGKAGLKLILVFPFVYVDTSEVWFEPRRRRLAVTAAGPVSDFALGGVFSLVCLALPAGSARDICFQLAFAAYLGGLFNLNPLLERDGYQMLADVLGEPKLRRRALEQLRGELRGTPASGSPVLARYSVFALGWWVVAGSFAAGLSVRYVPVLETFVPPLAAWALLGVVWLALFVPVLVILGPPLLARVRGRGS